jgi:uncharacterized protein YhfF
VPACEERQIGVGSELFGCCDDGGGTESTKEIERCRTVAATDCQLVASLGGSMRTIDVVTALPPIDLGKVEAFWSRAAASGAVAANSPLPSVIEPFGDSQELADELIELVIHGPKRATAAALADFEIEHSTLPRPGRLSIATDGRGDARAVLRTTDMRVGPLSSVDDTFAWDEGEGDRTRASWLADHEAFFRRYLPTIGVEFDTEMPTVFERFEVVYSE